jgi:hypothetical protein
MHPAILFARSFFLKYLAIRNKKHCKIRNEDSRDDIIIAAINGITIDSSAPASQPTIPFGCIVISS